MLKKSLSSLFVGLILSIVVSDASAEIVGSEFARPGQFSHHVSIQISNGKCSQHLCGGSIISQEYIITSAYCVADPVTRDFRNFPLTVVAGTTNLKDKRSGIYRNVQFAFIPASFAKKDFNDEIAILRLRHPLPLGSDNRIRAVNLPIENQYKSEIAWAAALSGFITSKLKSGASSPVLKFANGLINRYDNIPCTEEQICFMKNDNSCTGDNGGPLTDERTNTLIGVVSYPKNSVCGRTTKCLRVSAYLEFIYAIRNGAWTFRNSDDVQFFKYESDNEKIVQNTPYCQ